jgi:hypothetical protein
MFFRQLSIHRLTDEPIIHESVLVLQFILELRYEFVYTDTNERIREKFSLKIKSTLCFFPKQVSQYSYAHAFYAVLDWRPVIVTMDGHGF